MWRCWIFFYSYSRTAVCEKARQFSFQIVTKGTFSNIFLGYTSYYIPWNLSIIFALDVKNGESSWRIWIRFSSLFPSLYIQLCFLFYCTLLLYSYIWDLNVYEEIQTKQHQALMSFPGVCFRFSVMLRVIGVTVLQNFGIHPKFRWSRSKKVSFSFFSGETEPPRKILPPIAKMFFFKELKTNKNKTLLRKKTKDQLGCWNFRMIFLGASKKKLFRPLTFFQGKKNF